VNYTRFVQFLNPQLGMAAQNDGYPQNGQNPSRTWVSGELIVDPVRLAVARDARPGLYDLALGFYDLQNGLKRVPLQDGRGQAVPDNQLRLATLQIH
jgi:hypothetical protein